MDGEAAPKKQISFGKISFEQPSRRCVYIIAVVCFLCILCIVLATTLSRKPKNYCPEGLHCDWRAVHPAKFMQDERCESSCVSKPCLRSAGFALSRIDPSKDPCADFYEFACGLFEKEAVLFPDTNDVALTYHEMENELLLDLKEIIESVPDKSMGEASGALTLALNFYYDCLKTDQHSDVLDGNAMGTLVGDNGVLSWPLINDSISNDDEQLTKIMSSSIFYDANPFFSLQTVGERGEKGDGNHKLIFHFAEVNVDQIQNIPTESSGKQEDDLYLRYTSIIHRILRESGVPAPEIPMVSSEITRFEKGFKETALKAVNEADIEKVKGYDDVPRFAKFDCKGLEYMMQSLQWCKMVELLLEDMGRPTDSKVEVRFPGTMDYYETLNKVLSVESKRVLINYIVTKFIMSHLKYMPSPLRQMYYNNPEIFPPENKFRVTTTRWQQCIDVVSSFFWFPLEAEYINEKITESETKMVDFFVKKMKDVYISVLNRVPWIDAATKKDQVGEVEMMGLRLGNSFMWDTGEAEYTSEDFEKIARQEGQDASQMTLIKDILTLKSLIRTRSSSSASASSFMAGQPFKLLYNRIPTRLFMYYGNLEYPMFLHGRPMYISFATLGKSVLTGMSHLFVHNQLQRNPPRALNSRLKCIGDQLRRNGTVKGTSKEEEEERIYLNFHNTLATLATSEAYMKYLQENGNEKGLPGLPFSNEQLFFIFLAQMNCEKNSGERYKFYPAEFSTTPKERVNLPLSNSEEFSKAFRCSSGSAMNPEKKCCIHIDEKSHKNCK